MVRREGEVIDWEDVVFKHFGVLFKTSVILKKKNNDFLSLQFSLAEFLFRNFVQYKVFICSLTANFQTFAAHFVTNLGLHTGKNIQLFHAFMGNSHNYRS